MLVCFTFYCIYMGVDGVETGELLILGILSKMLSINLCFEQK